MRTLNRFLSLGSLLIIFLVATSSSPQPIHALSGCAEQINCHTAAACQIVEGEDCHEGTCVGIKVSAGDPLGQCESGPACSNNECEMALCTDAMN